MTDHGPHDQRRGWLKNSNSPGRNFTSLPQCGAKTRHGTACRCPAMGNGRCNRHGGCSTGPKTPEGRERSRRARLKHGRRTREAKAERAAYRDLMKQCRELLDRLAGGPR
jgi:hypothetical protein